MPLRPRRARPRPRIALPNNPRWRSPRCWRGRSRRSAARRRPDRDATPRSWLHLPARAILAVFQGNAEGDEFIAQTVGRGKVSCLPRGEPLGDERFDARPELWFYLRPGRFLSDRRLDVEPEPRDIATKLGR